MNMFKKLGNGARAFLLAMVAMLSVSPAFAQDADVGSTVATAIAAANPQIVTVIGAMAAALVIIVTWGLVRKAFGGK